MAERKYQYAPAAPDRIIRQAPPRRQYDPIKWRVPPKQGSGAIQNAPIRQSRAARQAANPGHSRTAGRYAPVSQNAAARPVNAACQGAPASRNALRRPHAGGAGTRRRRIRRRRFRALAAAALLCFVVMMAFYSRLPHFSDFQGGLPDLNVNASSKIDSITDGLGQTDSGQDFSQELQKLLELNPETKDYAENYPHRGSYLNSPIDLTEDFVSGEVPLLMQWDKRWGYDAYGDSMIGLAGCGPLCMTMAYLYFTEDTQMNPKKMADFAYEKGYYTSEGTKWSLWTKGAEKLGLSGRELSLDQKLMQRALDGGDLIVCSMRPGDFTTAGHFILIRGYDENGFYVNDPNRRSNSSKQWDFDTLQYQIRNLWALNCPN